MLEDDFPADIVKELNGELTEFSGKCYYDPEKRKIVFFDARDAEKAYIELEIRAMEKHKWIESEKFHRDLGDSSLRDWIKNYAENFSKFWRKTHEYILSEKREPAC